MEKEEEWVNMFFIVYVIPLSIILFFYLRRRKRKHLAAVRVLQGSYESGLTEPASLHPIIDPALCLGCGNCVLACPEGDILGIIHGKAVLVKPTNCIGHGACKAECPQSAIELVLGTEKRGVEVPVADTNFETNVPGLFVAGEITGMGLVKNTIAQGTLVMNEAAKYATKDETLDVVIVGIGPAGLAASLRAKELGINFVTLEQDSIGGTIAHYPRGKIVMTAPVDLPGYGKVKIRETSKEALLELWHDAIEKTGLEPYIQTGHKVKSIKRESECLVVETPTDTYQTRAVILAIGRRGSPRQLGVPGEEKTKVVYRLIDPEQYIGQKVLVVGGGDSALEAAVSISEEEGTEVTLCYRGDAFSRAKPANRERVENSRVNVMMSATPKTIHEESVCMTIGEQIKNDAVIVCIGGELPTGFLRDSGIDIEVRHGELE